MGLDMYAYTANKAGQREEYYNGSQWDPDTKDFVNPHIPKPVEIAYWRKHPHLHGWMFNLWQSSGNAGDFNGDELELTLDDLVDLELAVKTRSLPPTSGFFFGNPSDEHYHDTDLQFVADARQAIKEGYRVFYNSSW